MITEDTIKELDAALTGDGEGISTRFEEEFPDASPQAIENARRIEEQKAKVKELKTLVERRRALRQAQLTAAVSAVADEVEALKERSAAVAVNFGSPTEEEKEIVKEARTPKASSLLQEFFTQEH